MAYSNEIKKRAAWSKQSIGKESVVFKNYLRELCRMDMFLLHDIEKLAQEQEVYVFSGIIRDFFLEKPNYEHQRGKKKDVVQETWILY